MAVEINFPPPVNDYCADLPPLPDDKPVIRLPLGNQQVESAVDVTKGTPGSCSLTTGLLGDLQAALAPLKPLLDILDLVATMAQCVQLTSEVISNPFKIKDLLACIPGLVSKLNQVLALIPPFPQGYAQILTGVIDIVRYAIRIIDCVTQQLEVVQQAILQAQRDIESLERLAAEGANFQRLEELISCGMDTAEDTIDSAIAQLGPIARILCQVRSILVLQGDEGKKLAKELSFPDLSNTDALDIAIDALSLVRDTLNLFVELIEIAGAPIGAPFPPPALTFECPLDEDESAFETSEEAEPLLEPTITSITDPLGNPLALAAGAPATDIVVNGSDFVSIDQTVLYWGTSAIEVTDVLETRILATIPADVLGNSGTFLISAANQPPGGAVTPFSGLSDPASGESTEGEIKVSDPVEVTVS